MKYLEIYENFRDDIDKICQRYRIENYVINKDGIVDVFNDVSFAGSGLGQIPLNFGKVSGFFTVKENYALRSLYGSPNEVGDWFDCSFCTLKSLIGGPKSVGDNYYCNNNDLKDVRGFPENFHGLVFGSGNIVNGILSLVGTEKRTKFIKWLNEYDVIRDGNKIVEMRLEEAYWMACKEELPMDKRTFKNYQLI